MRLKAAYAWFLKIIFVHASVCVCICVCVHVSTPEGINNQWCDIGRVWLVKPILQPFKILLLINWKGVALVTQCIVHARLRCWSWHHTSHRRRRINYLVVATRWSTLVIKVIGQMRNNEFNRRLVFNFTVII